MRKMLTLFKALTLNWTRSRSGLFFSFIFPLLLLLVFGSVFSGTGQVKYGLHIQNRDLDPNGNPSNLSKIFIEALNSTKSFTLTLVSSKANPIEYIKNKTKPFSSRIRFLIIHEGFQREVINGSIKSQINVMLFSLKNFMRFTGGKLTPENMSQLSRGLETLTAVNQSLPDVKGKLTLLLDPSDTGGQVVKGIIYSVANAFSFKLVGAREVITLKTNSYTAKTYSAVDYYLPGYIAAFIMTNGVIGVTSVATDFKRRGILKRLMTTPLTKMEWILANVLSQTALGVLLTIVMIAFAWIFFRVTAVPGLYSWILILLGAILFTGFGMVLAGLVKDVEAASAIGNAVAFPMMFLSGSFWPLEIMPLYMQTIARFLPLTYLSEGLRFTLILDYPQGAVLDFILVGFLAVFFIFIASLVTSWREK